MHTEKLNFQSSKLKVQILTVPIGALAFKYKSINLDKTTDN